MTSADAKRLGKVAVLMGGTSAERAVSLMSGEGVLRALRQSGVQAEAFDPAERELGGLKREGFNRCFIALHGRHGEDGTVQGALEMLGVPYTGSGVLASALAMDKIMTKRLWQALGLPTPAWQAVHVKEPTFGRYDQRAELRDGTPLAKRGEELALGLGLPLIVKPVREGSSFGVTKVLEADGVERAISEAARFDTEVLCEECIVGEEVTCAVLGEGEDAWALPVVRIQAPDGNYDYQNKYFGDGTRYLCPSGLPAAEEREIKRIVLEAYRALGCRGWGRADLMIRGTDRKPFLLEMNTSPGMTSHSLVPMAALAASISYETLCVKLASWARLDGTTPGAPQP
jgi:D-alanine-D-alanine ligase